MDGFDRLGQVCFGARDCIYLRNQDQRQESILLHLIALVIVHAHAYFQ